MIEDVGWQDWAGFVAAYGSGFSWLWSDLDGVHLGQELPPDAPIATHLWGWAPNEWIRLRIDGDQVCGSRLVKQPGQTLERRPAYTWPETEGRVNIAYAPGSHTVTHLDFYEHASGAVFVAGRGR